MKEFAYTPCLQETSMHTKPLAFGFKQFPFFGGLQARRSAPPLKICRAEAPGPARGTRKGTSGFVDSAGLQLRACVLCRPVAAGTPNGALVTSRDSPAGAAETGFVYHLCTECVSRTTFVLKSCDFPAGADGTFRS